VDERGKAWLGTIVFLFAVPGVVAGLVPYLICGWRFGSSGVTSLLGGAAVGVGVAFLLHSFVEFAARGVGTPAPIAPTKHLVVTGAYRYVRNPMYLAVLAIIFGQALMFQHAAVAIYGALVLVTVAAFVRVYEEPTLSAKHGAEYDRYRAAVRAWIPRTSPYEGASDASDAPP
jgi:protein-S-isoprenylcysteine O-methyltransferase Ste14